MSEAKELAPAFPAPALPAPVEMVAKMQSYVTQWSGAWADMIQGFFKAEMAGLDAIGALYLKNDAVLPGSAVAKDPHEAALAWFASSKARLDEAFETQRRISDELRAGLFSAAEKLLSSPTSFLPAAELAKPAAAVHVAVRTAKVAA